MYTKIRYSPWDMVRWTRHEIALLLAFSFIVALLYRHADLWFFHVPWAPLAVIGTAVAFIVGFQNNAAYGRIWEARIIWGGIVNASRAWGVMACELVNNDQSAAAASEEQLASCRKTLIHRHLAWLTALRYAMRASRPWESFESHRTNREWSSKAYIPERETELGDALSEYLGETEREAIRGQPNAATAILNLQSTHIHTLKKQGHVWEFSWLEMQQAIGELLALQGKSERIKNFPYPRQYASLSYHFVRIFCFLFPFAAVPAFGEAAESMTRHAPSSSSILFWASVPFCALVMWVFYVMERIGRVGENPFEGSANDVPISTIARGIEIELLSMVGVVGDDLPTPFPPSHGVQM